MARRWVVVLAALAAAISVVVPPAAAKEGVHATLTSKIPTHASRGTRIVVAFTLRDGAGHPFNAQKVFVKLVCPEKTDSSIAFAANVHDGRYRAVAVVPPGGLGTIRIGLRGSTDIYFPITNNPLTRPH
jgi:uncharacterized protein (DUF2141 family)